MRRVDKPDFRSASGTGDTLNPPTQSVTWVETAFALLARIAEAGGNASRPI